MSPAAIRAAAASLGCRAAYLGGKAREWRFVHRLTGFEACRQIAAWRVRDMTADQLRSHIANGMAFRNYNGIPVWRITPERRGAVFSGDKK